MRWLLSVIAIVEKNQLRYQAGPGAEFADADALSAALTAAGELVTSTSQTATSLREASDAIDPVEASCCCDGSGE